MHGYELKYSDARFLLDFKEALYPVDLMDDLPSFVFCNERSYLVVHDGEALLYVTDNPLESQMISSILNESPELVEQRVGELHALAMAWVEKAGGMKGRTLYIPTDVDPEMAKEIMPHELDPSAVVQCDR